MTKIFTPIVVKKCIVLKDIFIAHSLNFNIIGYGNTIINAIDDLLESCLVKWKYCKFDLIKIASVEFYKEIENTKYVEYGICKDTEICIQYKAYMKPSLKGAS